MISSFHALRILTCFNSTGLGFAGFEQPDKTGRNEAESPWLPDAIGILITPQIMWYDKVAKQVRLIIFVLHIMFDPILNLHV